MRKIIAFLFASAGILILSSMNSVQPPETPVQWISIEEAIEKLKTEKRKVFIDVYTDWCGWCKKMDKATYTNPSIIEQIEKDYYFVKFNAERKEAIVFRDKTFSFNTQYRSHELAVGLLNGKMSYPSTVFLDENMDMLTVVPGYLEPDQLAPILKYFGENVYKEKTWDEYQKSIAN